MTNLRKPYPIALSLALLSLLFTSADPALALNLNSNGKSAPMLTGPTSESLGIAATPPRLYKATPKVYSKTIGNHGHAWWQWALNFSEAENPIIQNGVVDCSAGQSGKVWYLAGSFGTTADRTCSIPKNKAVFFPLVNSIWWTPLDPSVPEDCADELSCRTGAAELSNNITSWTCTIDGIQCAWYNQVVRGQSDALPFNILAGSFLETVGYVPGLRDLSISDGYWVMLDPLPIGQHTLHFTSAAPGFSLDITYHLTVK